MIVAHQCAILVQPEMRSAFFAGTKRTPPRANSSAMLPLVWPVNSVNSSGLRVSAKRFSAFAYCKMASQFSGFVCPVTGAALARCP